MTQRERFSSGGATAAAARPSPGHEVPSRAEFATAGTSARQPAWEELFAQVSPAQQHELLALARQQGLLYSHQLPVPTNGNGPAAEPGQPRWLRLLSGHGDELGPLPPLLPLDWRDRALNADQREAVLRAVQTPDVCLIQGAPGTGKSRVVAEIVLQAALRGERVLLLSTTAAAADRILELLGGEDSLCPIRILEPDEAAESLPVSSRGLIFRERVRQLGEQPLQAAQQELANLSARFRRLSAAEAVFENLRTLLAAAGSIEQALKHVADQCSRAPETAAQACEKNGSFAALQREREARTCDFAAQQTSVRERRARAEQARADLAPRLAELDPLVAAKERGQWWRAAWWRAAFQKNLLVEHASLCAHRDKNDSDLALLDEEDDQLRHEQQRAEQRWASERQRLLDEATERILKELSRQEAAARAELHGLHESWHAAAQQLETTSRPTEFSADHFEAAWSAWNAERKQCEEQCAFSAQWIRCLEETAETLEDRLVGYANLVAGTLAGFHADLHFGSRTERNFDLLIVQEAEQLARPELLQLSQRARRCVLVGESALGPFPAAKPAVAAASTAGVFQLLAQALQVEARRLPYEWFREAGRLCARLCPLSPEQRTRLEREPVLDRPEIELRILTLPRAEPRLAEIAFPTAFTLGQAKQYVFRELDELAVAPAGSEVYWHEQEECVVLQFGPAPETEAASVVLAPGVREVFHAEAAKGQAGARKTYRLEFARQDCWNRARAEDFVRRHLGLPELGRLVRLWAPQRALPELSAVLADLFGDFTGPWNGMPGQCVHQACANGCAPHVEFVAVARPPEKPQPASRSSRRDTPPPRLAPTPAKGGAGLELDLTDPRHRERLPAELRTGLPDQGFVNLVEARSIVRVLEELASSSTLRTPRSALEDRPAVAVMALYAAQAVLVRRLVEQSAVLQQAAFPVVIDVPEAFREQEFPIVLVSLTRSHVHRAVAFGGGPKQLALASTRARHKLILFGDPGTLARRRQWEGRVEQLTDAEAAGERAWVERLVHYLEGTGRHQRLFHLREGSPT
jgi:hypothetical protein